MGCTWIFIRNIQSVVTHGFTSFSSFPVESTYRPRKLNPGSREEKSDALPLHASLGVDQVKMLNDKMSYENVLLVHWLHLKLHFLELVLLCDCNRSCRSTVATSQEVTNAKESTQGQIFVLWVWRGWTQRSWQKDGANLDSVLPSWLWYLVPRTLWCKKWTI